MSQYFESLSDRRELLFFWLIGLFFSISLLYFAYIMRNKSKFVLITLTTTGVFSCIFMMFAMIVTLMSRISY
ncbi:hypothetical protein [Enterococcus ratti]|uniref:hypothetical protein n=1 Tax=Enterococcus ratti TaxID=150033 RepID=UPI0009004B2C|nr:hypothetical protein [Enterococcus ratti]